MSEYQYVGFRAIDAPVSNKNLEDMRTQSSHADIAAWSFDSEYGYGDFQDDRPEMLRRGFRSAARRRRCGRRLFQLRDRGSLTSEKKVNCQTNSS